MKLELSENDTRLLDSALYEKIQSLYESIFDKSSEDDDTPEILALEQKFMAARDLYIRLRRAAGEEPEEWIETTTY